MPTTPKLNALTGLRFFAAASIVIYHLYGFGLPRTVLEGWMLDNGVGFFFVLSGFILAYVYPSLDHPGAVKRFWIARFARIWPAHIAALLLCYLLLDFDPSRLSTGVDSLAVGAANLALVHAWIPYPTYFFGYNNVSWSISTEAFFYLVFPLLIVAFARTWWWKLALAAAIAGGLIAICTMAELPVFTSLDDGITTTGLIYISPLARLFEFILGMSAAVLWRKTQAKATFGVGVGTIFEVAAILLTFVMVHYVKASVPWVQENIGYAAVQWVGQGGGLALGFALVILVMAYQQGIFSRALSTKLGVFLGEISFMVYLVHYVILRAYRYRAELFEGWTGEALLAAYIASVLVVSTLLWRLVELPIRGMILRAFAPPIRRETAHNAPSSAHDGSETGVLQLPATARHFSQRRQRQSAFR